MRFGLTTLGCKALVMLVALAIAYFATSYSNLFFLMLSFCGVTGALAAAWTLGNLRGVVVHGIEVPPAAAGAERTVRIDLETPPRGAWDLAVELRIDGARCEVADAARVAGRTTLIGKLPPRARGIAALHSVHVVTRYPFGLFWARRRRLVKGEVVTHPDPVAGRAQLAGRRGRGDIDGGDASRHAVGDVIGLRAFRSGDSLAAVHWPGTARSGQPIVKERDASAVPQREYVLDRRCAPDELERRLAVATALVLDSSERALRLISQGFDAKVGSERNAAQLTLRWLAAASALPADAAPPHAEPPRAASPRTEVTR